MNIRAGLGEYILQTHNTKMFLKIQWGVEPLTPSGYASAWRHFIFCINYVLNCCFGSRLWFVSDYGLSGI